MFCQKCNAVAQLFGPLVKMNNSIKNIFQQVTKGQETECETGISDCLESKLSVTNGNNKVGNY